MADAVTAPAAEKPTPTPRQFYVHDDLTAEVRDAHGAGSEACALARDLLALVGRDQGRVTLLTLEAQLSALLARGPHAPFALAVGIPLGVVAGARPGTFPDRVALASAVIGQALPTFLLALTLIFWFGPHVRPR